MTRNFIKKIELVSLLMIKSTGVDLRMSTFMSKVSYFFLLLSKNVTSKKSIVFDFKQRLSNPELTL